MDMHGGVGGGGGQAIRPKAEPPNSVNGRINSHILNLCDCECQNESMNNGVSHF